MPAGEDVGELSDVLPAGAGAGLCILRKALLIETVTPPSPHPNGGLLLLPAVPANFLTEGGPGVSFQAVPTAYGVVDFVAVRHSSNTVSVAFRYSLHVGGFTAAALAQVSVRLVTPGSVGVRCSAPGATQMDAWTVTLPGVSQPGTGWHNFSVDVLRH